jgi:RhtB (resistance to homoserine/threonine) family protein
VTVYLGEFATLALIHFLAVLVPGPDFAINVSQSVRFGRRIGVLTALGIGAGISVHVIYTLFGVRALMHTTPWTMKAAKFLGGAYVLYLGWKLLQAKPRDEKSLGPPLPAGASSRREKAFVMGFFTNATNPKATLFFLAIFTTIVSAYTPLAVQMIYGVWMCFVNALWFSLVAVFFSHERIRATFLRLGHWFERIMGIILVLFAVRLFVDI